MGLIKAAVGAVGGVLADQWKEFFYCDALPENVLAVKGRRRTGGRSSNTKGDDNVITEGSGIAVADGQAMMIVEQGKVLDYCDEPGEYTFDFAGEPSLFAGGSLSRSALDSLKSAWERFKFGGIPGRDTRVYYFNTKELVGNKYGTPNPVPFRVVDRNIGLDIDIAIRCFGEYSYRLENPVLFYTNVCGNVSDAYTRDRLDGQLKTELMTALQPAFGKISDMGIRYSALPGHTLEMAEALNEVLSAKWRDTRGLSIVSFGVSSVKASEDDENMIKELQRSAAFRNPDMAAARLVDAQATAMQSAASNKAAGPAMAFMGMNMAANAGGMNARELFGMGQRQAAAAAPGAAVAWTCACGHTGNTGKFCAECGQPAVPPEPAPRADSWTCVCGAVNRGKFCSECGQPAVPAGPRPAAARRIKCDKCGWEPAAGEHPPKFCQNCGGAMM